MISDVVEFSEREHLHKFVLFDTILLNIIAIISSVCLKIILLRLITSVKPSQLPLDFTKTFPIK